MLANRQRTIIRQPETPFSTLFVSRRPNSHPCPTHDCQNFQIPKIRPATQKIGEKIHQQPRPAAEKNHRQAAEPQGEKQSRRCTAQAAQNRAVRATRRQQRRARPQFNQRHAVAVWLGGNLLFRHRLAHVHHARPFLVAQRAAFRHGEKPGGLAGRVFGRYCLLFIWLFGVVVHHRGGRGVVSHVSPAGGCGDAAV